MVTSDKFLSRFTSREQAEHYRDRYAQGRRVRMNQLEHKALLTLLSQTGHFPLALDMPSGTGRLSDALATFANRTILVDGSPLMLEVARDGLPGFPGWFVCSDAMHLGLKDQSVELIFTHRFFQHISDYEERGRILRELARVSRRYVIISFFNPGLRRRFQSAIRRLWGKRRGHRLLQSLNDLTQEASEANLKLVHQDLIRRFPRKAMFCLFEQAQARGNLGCPEHRSQDNRAVEELPRCKMIVRETGFVTKTLSTLKEAWQCSSHGWTRPA